MITTNPYTVEEDGFVFGAVATSNECYSLIEVNNEPATRWHSQARSNSTVLEVSEYVPVKSGDIVSFTKDVLGNSGTSYNSRIYFVSMR